MDKQLSYEQKKIREILDLSNEKIKRFESKFYKDYTSKKVNEIINYTNIR